MTLDAAYKANLGFGSRRTVRSRVQKERSPHGLQLQVRSALALSRADPRRGAADAAVLGLHDHLRPADRASGRDGEHQHRPGPACRGAGLRRGDPQHAAAGAALHHLFRPAVARDPARCQHRGADRAVGQPGRLCGGDPAGRLRVGAAQPDRGGAGARADRRPDLPPRHPLPGAEGDLSGADQPVRHDHADDERGLVDRRHRALQHRRLHRLAHLPVLRGLCADHRVVPGAHHRLPQPVRGGSLAGLRAPEPGR